MLSLQQEEVIVKFVSTVMSRTEANLLSQTFQVLSLASLQEKLLALSDSIFRQAGRQLSTFTWIDALRKPEDVTLVCEPFLGESVPCRNPVKFVHVRHDVFGSAPQGQDTLNLVDVTYLELLFTVNIPANDSRQTVHGDGQNGNKPVQRNSVASRRRECANPKMHGVAHDEPFETPCR